jgi:hypothetical protein
MMRHGMVGIFISVCLIGCVSSNFSTVTSPYNAPQKLFTVEVPNNWKKFKAESIDSSLVITRDGLELQYIRVAVKSPTSNLSFTKRKISQGMMPQELADLFIDDLKSNHEFMNLEILGNKPATINQHEGFLFVYRYSTQDGLKKKGSMCGYLQGIRAYLVQYVAAERVYYQKDLSVFESVKESLR